MIAYLLLNLFWVYILYRFNTYFFGCSFTNKKRLTASYILFYLLNSCVHIIFHHPILNMLTSLVGFFIISVNYAAGIMKRLLSIAFFYVVSMLCDIATAVTVSKYYPGKRLTAEATAITYLMLFIIEIIIERIFDLRKVQKLNYSHWSALIGVPISSIAIICVIIMEGFPNKRINLIIILLLLLINIFIFYLYDSIQNVYLKDLRHEYMEKQLEAYTQQMDVMVKSQDKINALRHDLKHHINIIAALIKEKQFQDVNLYIKRMETALEETAYHRYSANHVIDSILNYMLSDAQTDFKNLSIDIQLPSELGIDYFDISIILGNLLANAVHASLNSKEKYLRLQMKLEKGILFISVENSFEHELRIQNGNYISTKTTHGSEKHGIGLSNVKNVTEKYNGKVTISHKNHIFTVNVILYTEII